MGLPCLLPGVLLLWTCLQLFLLLAFWNKFQWLELVCLELIRVVVCVHRMAPWPSSYEESGLSLLSQFIQSLLELNCERTWCPEFLSAPVLP